MICHTEREDREGLHARDDRLWPLDSPLMGDTARSVRTPSLPPNAAMRWSVVRKIVNGFGPASILEIGCGQGGFGARLAPLTSTYLAVEPDASSCAVAKSRIEPRGGTVLNIAAEDLGSDQTFDLVCAFEVLEHIDDDRAALHSWHDRTAPGGHILLSMPAWQERFNDWDTMVGHYRRYSPSDCRSRLAEAGFEDIEVVVYGWPLGLVTEKIRSMIAGRRTAGTPSLGEASMQERTAGSGRVLQPKTAAGIVIEGATLPFAQLQRLSPTRGTGVIATGRRRR